MSPNSVAPSSSTSVGIFPSGFCSRKLSAGFIVSAGSDLIWSSRPSSEMPTRTLRTNGEAAEPRRIIITSVPSTALQIARQNTARTYRLNRAITSKAAHSSPGCRGRYNNAVDVNVGQASQTFRR